MVASAEAMCSPLFRLLLAVVAVHAKGLQLIVGAEEQRLVLVVRLDVIYVRFALTGDEHTTTRMLAHVEIPLEDPLPRLLPPRRLIPALRWLVLPTKPIRR